MSRFVFRLAWRETRGAWRHFGYFFACITLGVSALVGVGSFADSLERTVARSAKSLMGGDVEVRSSQPLPADAAPLIAPIRADVATTRVRELVAMAPGGPVAEPHRRAQGGGAGLSLLRRARDRPAAPARHADRRRPRARARLAPRPLRPPGRRPLPRRRPRADHHRRHPEGAGPRDRRLLAGPARADRRRRSRAHRAAPPGQPRALPHARPPARGRATPRPSATGSRPRCPRASACRPTARPSPACGASGTSSRCTWASPASWR